MHGLISMVRSEDGQRPRLSRSPPAQELRDRWTQCRHGRRLGVVPPWNVRRRRRPDRESRAPPRGHHARLPPSSARHRGERRPGPRGLGVREPGLKLNLIDRYLVSAEIGGVRPVIVLNKADLVDLAMQQWVVGLYVQLGYETIVTSVADGRGVDRLRVLLTTGVTAVTGQSGVGKSSLLNAIQPDLKLKVREVSEWTSKGKHTTTTAELIELAAGGFVVDTPGLRQFELWGIAPDELGGHFVEFRPFIPFCRFPDCSHTHERECAVKQALSHGQIHAGRYESYLKLYQREPVDEE